MSKERKSNKEVKKPKKQPDGVAKPKDDKKIMVARTAASRDSCSSRDSD